MIRITSKLYIHFSTLIMLAVCALNSRAAVYLFTYAVMAAHEAAHMAAAVFIGLKTDRIVFYPYGVNLKLKNKFVHSLADELILYMAGPLLNCMLALMSLFLYGVYRQPVFQLIYASNIMLFVSNMLPVYPLDGGVAAKKLLSYFLGSKSAGRVMKGVSAVLAAAMLAFGAYAVYVTEFNFSVMLLAAFLFCSVFAQNEKYDVDFVRELMFYGKKKKRRIKHFVASERDDKKSIAARFAPRYYGIVYIENDNGEIKSIKTETEIMNDIVGRGQAGTYKAAAEKRQP